MIELALDAIPNQRLSAALEGAYWEIEIKTLDNGTTAVSLWRDGETVIQGVRAMPNRVLIPYAYREAGNFAFLATGDDYPDYPRFGADVRLVYASAAELSEMRNA
ncbi:MAG: hypothetical protein LBP58_06930 [Azoarcus sp.]|jgi:hypothetical protein|nr:hypothetical protein [Azoarcus sp.]